MLNIPTSVKTLFQTDGVRKNFRVHFPNGELADITNDNVVQESVHFTESLCSQSTFKFGLAEASVLEFETVGVANMYGMTIEASIEIDCSSLSAGDKSAIAAGTWDGTWDAVNSVFSVPLGTFRVNSCPRNHGAMAHRQVTAYAYGMTADGLTNQWQKKVENAFAAGKNFYTPNLKALYYTLLCKDNPELLVSYGYTRTAVAAHTPSYIGARTQVPLKKSDSTSVSFNISNAVYEPISTYNAQEEIVQIENNFSEHIAEAKTYLLDYLTAKDIDPVLSGYESMDALIEDLVNGPNSLGVADVARSKFEDWFDTFRSANVWRITDDNPILVYPYRNSEARGRIEGYLCFGIQFSIGGYQQELYTFTNEDKMWLYSPNTSSYLSCSFESTLTQTVVPASGNKFTLYSFANAYSATDLIQGMLEMNATFLKCGRDGINTPMRLSNDSPMSVIPENYSDCWWDEYDVEPIGTVNVTYKETDNGTETENTAGVEIGTGASIYDMTSNTALKMLANNTLTKITNLLNSGFKPYVGEVEFTPIELTMQGWPWIEAGDALQITAEDGTVVDTYALRIEMSGIQNLSSVITAQGGEIIE